MRGPLDDRLQTQIEEAGDAGEVELVVLLADDSARSAKSAGEKLIARVAGEVNEAPLDLGYMPNLGAVFVKGSGRFVRHLLEQEEVASASAADADAFIPGPNSE